ncbi:competence protein CoiA family protein [Streptomyces sp. NPDC051776]|uniref:competence protein CoiA n=1 Tax=Streptomyces sp. NPDC051776 TaxID=3155414 RepID=UPI00343EB516
MAFTALHADVGRIDATAEDLGCGLEWNQVYRVRPRVALTCPECGWGVHAKHSPRRVRYFAHDPGRPPTCELSNESWEHHMLKLELAGAVRDAGWYAELEVAAADGSWRADVMASSPDGQRRMAWEAQLSPITVDEVRARTERYENEGISVCWVTPHGRKARWIGAVPAVRVREPDTEGGAWIVDDGLAGFDYRAGRWVFREESLSCFVRWAVLGQVVPCRSLPRYRRVDRVVEGRHLLFRRSMWWTSQQSAQAQQRHEQMRRRQEAWKKEREEREEQRQAEEARRRAEEEAAAAKLRAEQRAAEQARRDEEARQRLLRWEEEDRRRRAAEEERRAREEAARREYQQQIIAAANSWWQRLSPQQVEELFAVVSDKAWKEERLPVQVPEDRSPSATLAYGVPVRIQRRRHFTDLYGVIRPCPALVAVSPGLLSEQVFVRNAGEADELVANGVAREKIVHFDLPDHEQLSF